MKKVDSFSRKVANDIASEAVQVLNEHFKEMGIEFRSSGGRFTAAVFDVKFKVTIPDGKGGVKVTDHANEVADTMVKAKGVTFEGHFINSKWENPSNGKVYIVREFSTKRPKYPISLEEISTGKRFRCAIGLMKQYKQVTDESHNVGQPCEEDFNLWFTGDIDNLPDDMREITDEVQGYLDDTFPNDEVDDLCNVVNELNGLGAAERYAERAYYLLFNEGIEACNDELYAVVDQIKERESEKKPKSKKK